MEDDEIMKELRKARQQLLADAGGDLGELLKRANRDAPLILERFRRQSGPKGVSARPSGSKRPRFRSARGRPAQKG
jgi:hypothetical protein